MVDFSQVTGKHDKDHASLAYGLGHAVIVNAKGRKPVLIEPGLADSFHFAMLLKGLRLLGIRNSKRNSVWYQILTPSEYESIKAEARRLRKKGAKEKAIAKRLAVEYISPIATTIVASDKKSEEGEAA